MVCSEHSERFEHSEHFERSARFEHFEQPTSALPSLLASESACFVIGF